MTHANTTPFSYEPEADVLSWELNQKPIAFAEEFGTMVVHFAKDRTPVLIEVLEARTFLKRARELVSATSSG